MRLPGFAVVRSSLYSAAILAMTPRIKSMIPRITRPANA
jgi:hypothetical protein